MSYQVVENESGDDLVVFKRREDAEQKTEEDHQETAEQSQTLINRIKTQIDRYINTDRQNDKQ